MAVRSSGERLSFPLSLHLMRGPVWERRWEILLAKLLAVKEEILSMACVASGLRPPVGGVQVLGAKKRYLNSSGL